MAREAKKRAHALQHGTPGAGKRGASGLRRPDNRKSLASVL
jgi:hypothetical protein